VTARFPANAAGMNHAQSPRILDDTKEFIMKSTFAIQLTLITAMIAACSGPAEPNHPNDTNTPLEPGECAAHLQSERGMQYKCPTNPVQPVECASLSENACSENPDCMSLMAQPVDTALQCADHREFLECQPNVGCAEAMAVVRDPSGKQWQFPSHCWPEGWTFDSEFHKTKGHVENCFPPEPPDPTKCSGLSEYECKANSNCMAVDAWPVDMTRKCVAPKTMFVDCQSDRTCPAATAIATNPSGHAFLFPSLCTPEGWTVEHDISGLAWDDPDCVF